MASHATSTHSGLRLSLPVTTDTLTMPAVVTVPSSPNLDTPVCNPPVRAHNPVGKHAQQLLPMGQVGTPSDHNGAGEGDAELGLRTLGLRGHVPHGKEMPLPPVRPGRHPLRPGRIRSPSGQGDPGGQRWAVPKSSRDGMGTITSRPAACPRPAPEVASLGPPVVRSERTEASLGSPPASLGARSSPVPRAASVSASGTCTRWCGVNRQRAWCRGSGDDVWNGTYKQGEVCKAPLEEGGARMEQCNDETNKLDEIHTNSRETRTKFVPISYEFHGNLCIHTHV